MVEARAVDIVAERCQQGVKEIRLRLRRDPTRWREEHATEQEIVTYTNNMGQSYI